MAMVTLQCLKTSQPTNCRSLLLFVLFKLSKILDSNNLQAWFRILLRLRQQLK